jgi:medium-chain acyl-[acyl-carrier-protein] hydrolase
VADAWISRPKPKSISRLRLFCFPHAGGGASTFFAWPTHLPAKVELCAVQYPGREERLSETPYVQFPALVAAIAEAIYPYLNKPFAFFGHSLGALVCFETAQYLRQQGALSPVHLFVSGCRAPQFINSNSPPSTLSDAMFIEEVRQRYGGIPDLVMQNHELLELFLPILRADFALLGNYRYEQRPPLCVPLSVFGGEADHQVHYGHLTAWREQTQGDFALNILPGNHFFLHKNRERICHSLGEDLAGYLG